MARRDDFDVDHSIAEGGQVPFAIDRANRRSEVSPLTKFTEILAVSPTVKEVGLSEAKERENSLGESELPQEDKPETAADMINNFPIFFMTPLLMPRLDTDKWL